MKTTIQANQEYIRYLELFRQGAPEEEINASLRAWTRKVRQLKNQEPDEPAPAIPGAAAKRRPE